jgi:hypothetical protein
MKCIAKGSEVKRVSDTDAELRVKQHGWKYVPKSEWKLYTRGPVETTKREPVTASVDTAGLSIEQKRLMRKKRTPKTK